MNVNFKWGCGKNQFSGKVSGWDGTGSRKNTPSKMSLGNKQRKMVAP